MILQIIPEMQEHLIHVTPQSLFLCILFTLIMSIAFITMCIINHKLQIEVENIHRTSDKITENNVFLLEANQSLINDYLNAIDVQKQVITNENNLLHAIYDLVEEKRAINHSLIGELIIIIQSKKALSVNAINTVNAKLKFYRSPYMFVIEENKLLFMTTNYNNSIPS